MNYTELLQTMFSLIALFSVTVGSALLKKYLKGLIAQ